MDHGFGILDMPTLRRNVLLNMPTIETLVRRSLWKFHNGPGVDDVSA